MSHSEPPEGKIFLTYNSMPKLLIAFIEKTFSDLKENITHLQTFHPQLGSKWKVCFSKMMMIDKEEDPVIEEIVALT